MLYKNDSEEKWRFRDWLWVVGILLFIIILMFIALFYKDNNVRNYFSFASILYQLF